MPGIAADKGIFGYGSDWFVIFTRPVGDKQFQVKENS